MQKAKYGFEMKIIGYDPYLTQGKVGDLCELKVRAREVWEQADFVSIHLPVVDSTHRSIGREQFSWMKPTAPLINCARGALIKENEPIQASSKELFALDNIIMTPHMAATTEQAILNCCTSVANDIAAVCRGESPRCPAVKPKF